MDILEKYDDILTPKDLQEILHSSRNTVYKFLNNGTIPSVRLGDKILIPKADIINFFMLHRKDYDNEQDKETGQKS